MQVEEVKSVNESLNLTVEELSKARELAEATLREKDELIYDKCKKMRLLEEQSGLFYENNLEKVYKTKESVLLKDIDPMKSQVSELLKKLKILDQEMKQQINLLRKTNEDSNDVLKQRLETKFKFLKHDNSLKKMIEMTEKENKTNVSKIFITSLTFETKNWKFVKEMEDKVKCFDEEKKAFETKISKLKK
nr:hypothetical protein [Tanacetum cinerariifolium]